MGIYYNDFIYFGLVLQQQQYEKLIQRDEYKMNENEYKKYIFKINSSYILHLPSTFFNFKNIDQMLDGNEIEQKCVSFSEVERVVKSINPSIVEAYGKLLNGNYDFNSTDKEIQEFNILIGLLNRLELELEPQLYMCEVCWTSYELPNANETIIHNFPIKKIDRKSNDHIDNTEHVEQMKDEINKSINET